MSAEPIAPGKRRIPYNHTALFAVYDEVYQQSSGALAGVTAEQVARAHRSGAALANEGVVEPSPLAIAAVSAAEEVDRERLQKALDIADGMLAAHLSGVQEKAEFKKQKAKAVRLNRKRKRASRSSGPVLGRVSKKAKKSRNARRAAPTGKEEDEAHDEEDAPVDGQGGRVGMGGRNAKKATRGEVSEDDGESSDDEEGISDDHEETAPDDEEDASAGEEGDRFKPGTLVALACFVGSQACFVGFHTCFVGSQDGFVGSQVEGEGKGEGFVGSQAQAEGYPEVVIHVAQVVEPESDDSDEDQITVKYYANRGKSTSSSLSATKAKLKPIVGPYIIIRPNIVSKEHVRSVLLGDLELTKKGFLVGPVIDWLKQQTLVKKAYLGVAMPSEAI